MNDLKRAMVANIPYGVIAFLGALFFFGTVYAQQGAAPAALDPIAIFAAAVKGRQWGQIVGLALVAAAWVIKTLAKDGLWIHGKQAQWAVSVGSGVVAAAVQAIAAGTFSIETPLYAIGTWFLTWAAMSSHANADGQVKVFGERKMAVPAPPADPQKAA